MFDVLQRKYDIGLDHPSLTIGIVYEPYYLGYIPEAAAHYIYSKITTNNES